MTPSGEVLRFLLNGVDPLVPDFWERSMIIEMVHGTTNWIESEALAWPELQKILIEIAEKEST